MLHCESLNSLWLQNMLADCSSGDSAGCPKGARAPAVHMSSHVSNKTLHPKTGHCECVCLGEKCQSLDRSVCQMNENTFILLVKANLFQHNNVYLYAVCSGSFVHILIGLIGHWLNLKCGVSPYGLVCI